MDPIRQPGESNEELDTRKKRREEKEERKNDDISKKKKKEATPVKSKLRGERAPPFKRKYKSDYARGYQFGPHSVQGNPWSAPSFYPQQWGQVG